MGREPVSVLVVDDLVPFRRAAASVIAVAEGFVLAGEATSGEEALDFLERRGGVALVLMDVNMPGMGGVRAAEQIRSRFPDVVVVLLSIHHHQELRRAATSCGAGYCHKERFGPDALEALWDHKDLIQA